jgi:asparagine synthase (glutamine-hydrolysing)
MCGIAGVLRYAARRGVAGPWVEDVRAMTAALTHRGLDGAGVWADQDVALGHTRLAIVDRSDAGAQPMTRGHLTISYNGELYNHADLRRALSPQHRFTSGTDTEVVLAAWLRWGPAALERFDGMFAIALWDTRARRLYLARDRLGIKPLYMHRGRGFIAFASEIQALLASLHVPRYPNLEALYHQLLRSTTLEVDPHRTAVRQIEALPPAACRSIDVAGYERTTTYWVVPGPDAAADRVAAEAPDALANELRGLVSDSVTRMLMGDVPVAAFLSGSLDSGVITATAATADTTNDPITALTLSHRDDDIGRTGTNGPTAARADAAPPPASPTGAAADLAYSRLLVSRYPGRLRHHVHTRPAALSLADIDAVCDLAVLGDDARHVWILANYQALARLGGQVVLSGQGADEIMGGYVGLASFRASILDITRPSSETIRNLPAARQATGLSPEVLRHEAAAHDQVLTFHAALPGQPLEAAHRLLTHTQLRRVTQFEDFLGMRAGVEARFPYLSHRIVEWAFTTPFDHHVNPARGEGKTLLRRAFRTALPHPVLTRRKQVFPHPPRGALEGSLRVLAAEHQPEVYADPLITHLFTLPHPGHFGDLPVSQLFRVLTAWRWHHLLRRPVTTTRPVSDA